MAHRGPRGPAAHGVTPVLESLLHLLPTSASVFSADGDLLAAAQASPLCRLLAQPRDAGLPDLCARDCRALAREAASVGGRVRAACSAGLQLVAEPLPDAAGRAAGLGVLVAAIGDLPREASWDEVAHRFQRDVVEVRQVAARTPRRDQPEWEDEERIEVAATVLARVLAGEPDHPRLAPPPSSRVVSARRQTAQLVLEIAHAASEAVDERDLLRWVPQRVRTLLALPSAWTLLVRDGEPAELLEAPPGLTAAGFGREHPAIVRADSSPKTAHHASFSDWSNAAELAGAGIGRLLVTPIHALGRLEALLMFASDPREETPASLARRCGLLDDIAPILAANLATARALAATRRRNQQLTALHEACTRVSASLDQGEVLDAVSAGFAEVLGFTRSAVLLHDPTRGTLLVAEPATGAAERAPALEGPLGSLTAAVQAAGGGHAVLVRAAANTSARRRELFGVGDHVLAPLQARGRLVGFVAADRGGENFQPTPEELELATILAQAAASALDHARLHATSLDRAAILAALADVTRTLSSTLEPDAAARVIVDAASRLHGSEGAVLLLRGDQGWSSAAAPPGLAASFRADDPLLSDASAEGVRRRRLDGYAGGLGLALFERGHQHALLVPLCWEGECRATLVLPERGDPASPARQEALGWLATHAVIALRNAELHASLQSSLAQLRTAHERLVQSERLRSVRELASSLAHDMSDVLQNVMARATHALEATAVLPADARANLEAITRACEDGAAVVRRLQQAGQAPKQGLPQPRTVVVAEIVAQAARVVAGRLADRTASAGLVDLVQRLDPAPRAAVDAATLRELVTTLLVDSIESLHRGGTLELSTGERREASGERVAFVRLAGGVTTRTAVVGFPGAPSPASGGSALGEMARALGGRLESAPGEAAVTLILPAAPAETALDDDRDVRGTTSPDAPRLLRILVVDDDEDSRVGVGGLLQSWGHHVMLADCGEAALEVLARGRVDAVLTDLAMPGLSGWEVARRVRLVQPETPVAVLTGWTVELDDATMRRRGVAAVLEKPASPERLRSLLAELARGA